MPRAAPPAGLDKFSRYRAGRKAQGMKLLWIWVARPVFARFS
jgi:hypothetical protein